MFRHGYNFDIEAFMLFSELVDKSESNIRCSEKKEGLEISKNKISRFIFVS